MSRPPAVRFLVETFEPSEGYLISPVSNGHQCIIGTQISERSDITGTSRSSPNSRACRFAIHRLSDAFVTDFRGLRTRVAQSLV
jgi:hypothetical protein